MRDINFRAWNTVGKKMHPDSDWAYEWHMIKEQHESGLIVLLQHTGLKDVNGVEIYEGDILAYGEIVPERPVIFENGAFRLQDDDDNHTNQILVVDTAMRLEVIGNVYENPELLK